MTMTEEDKRGIAIGAVRAMFRRLELEPNTVEGRNAWTMLDELWRQNPKAVAAVFYQEASDYQYRCFVREWNAWRKQDQQSRAADAQCRRISEDLTRFIAGRS